MASQSVGEISALAETNYRSSVQALGALPEALSIERFLAHAASVGRYDDYGHVPMMAESIVREVDGHLGAEGARRFLRAALLGAVCFTVRSDRLKRLPPRVRLQQLGQLGRIASDTDANADWLDLSADLFRKELGLASLRLYAAGAQLVDPRCGVPRSFLVRGSVSQLSRRLKIAISLRGFRPFFQIHTHAFMLDAFSETGWEECYRCCAELYDLHPETLGMFGASWFYDPAIEEVSPRLAYLRQTPLENGAHVVFWEDGGSAIHNALATSKSRRELYEAGRYKPTNYMLLWGRERQLHWAQSTLPDE